MWSLVRFLDEVDRIDITRSYSQIAAVQEKTEDQSVRTQSLLLPPWLRSANVMANLLPT